MPLKVDVMRDCGSMGREAEDGRIENVYRLQIMNASESPRRFRLGVGAPGLEMTHWQVVVEGEGRRWRLARSWSPRKDAALRIAAVRLAGFRRAGACAQALCYCCAPHRLSWSRGRRDVGGDT